MSPDNGPGRRGDIEKDLRIGQDLGPRSGLLRNDNAAQGLLVPLGPLKRRSQPKLAHRNGRTPGGKPFICFDEQPAAKAVGGLLAGGVGVRSSSSTSSLTANPPDRPKTFKPPFVLDT